MKVFRVVTERDGTTTKVPGKVVTDIVQAEHLFAADSMLTVWNAALEMCHSTGDEIVSIAEVAPAIFVLEEPK